MKTLTLDEAFKQATQGPLTRKMLDGSTKFDHVLTSDGVNSVALVQSWPHNKIGPISQDQTNANAALLAHAFNVLPEVVNLLDKAMEIIKGEYPESQWRELGVHDMEAALTKANQVQIP